MLHERAHALTAALGTEWDRMCSEQGEEHLLLVAESACGAQRRVLESCSFVTTVYGNFLP